MHYLKINVEDNVYSHLKFFLDGLNNKGIEVVEDKIVEKNYIEQINRGKKDDSNEIVKFDKIVDFIRNSKK